MSLSNPSLVAVCGGGNVKQLGLTSEVVAFFIHVRRFASTSLGPEQQNLLLDRLYRRYLRIEEVESSLAALTIVQRCFEGIRSGDVDWKALGVDLSKPRFQSPDTSLAFVWSDLIRRVTECGDASIYFCHSAKSRFLDPVRLSRSDFASLDREKKRPLGEYDALDGPRFWLAEPPSPAQPRAFKDGKEVPLGTPGAVTPAYV